MRTRLLALFAVSVILTTAAVFAADDNKFDKTIGFPRGGQVPLNWSFQKCTIQSVKVVDYPADFEVDKARREDPNDKSNIGWEFVIDNRSSTKYEVHVSVEILDKSGQVIKAGDRNPTVGAHEAETAKVSTRMRTIEAADAPKVRLRAEIVPK